MHQVGDQPRLYYDARSTNHQDWSYEFLSIYSFEIVKLLIVDILMNIYFRTVKAPNPVAAPSKVWFCGPRLLGLRFRIPLRAWISVFCECCVLSGRVLCDRPIPRPEESYRVWCVVESVCVCVFVCLSWNVIRCRNNPPHLTE